MVDNLTKKKKLHKKKSEKNANGLSDPRFEHVSQDPKFWTMARKERKVAVDKRFAGMFSEPKFRLEYTVDKRGRPMRKSTDDHLKHLYELSSDEERDEDDSEKTPTPRKSATKGKKNDKVASKKDVIEKETADHQPASSSDEQEEDEEDEDVAVRLDLARGDGNISSSSGDSSSEWEFEDDDDVDHGWAELDKDARRTDEATARLAVCNMDWDRVRAADLLVLLNSFKPEGGVVRSVVVYPSEFGKERMAQEDLTGPNIKPIVPKKNAKRVGDESDDDEQSEDNDEKLSRDQVEAMRNYQLDRLKYYYAVVDCDSVTTASKIYDECDGMEYEASAVRLDIRFVPDNMTFDDKARDEATMDSLNVDKYKPRMWETAALQKSNIKLTWDETDPERIKATRAAFDPNADIDQFQDLIAPASSDEEAISDNEGAGKKYQTLLDAAGLDRESGPTGTSRAQDDEGVEMEISWEPGLSKSGAVSKKQKSKDQVTPWQQYLEKRKEKKRQHKASIKEKRRATKLDNEAESGDEQQDKPLSRMDDGESAQLDLLLADEKDDIGTSKKHFNLKDLVKQQAEASKNKKKLKRKRETEPIEKQTADSFLINPDDDRFSAVYKSHLFNIDRSDPNYKATLGMERLVAEKSKRKMATVDEVAPSVEDKKSSTISNGVDTLQLAKSLKTKTAQWADKKQTRTAVLPGKKSKKP